MIIMIKKTIIISVSYLIDKARFECANILGVPKCMRVFGNVHKSVRSIYFFGQLIHIHCMRSRVIPPRFIQTEDIYEAGARGCTQFQWLTVEENGLFIAVIFARLSYCRCGRPRSGDADYLSYPSLHSCFPSLFSSISFTSYYSLHSISPSFFLFILLPYFSSILPSHRPPISISFIFSPFCLSLFISPSILPFHLSSHSPCLLSLHPPFHLFSLSLFIPVPFSPPLTTRAVST